MSFIFEQPGTSALGYYAALECASHEMLQAARAGDWDSVCRLEAACAVVISRLRQVRESRPLAQNEQAERMRILRTILTNDAEIRRICDPMPAFLDPRSMHVGEVSLSIH